MDNTVYSCGDKSKLYITPPSLTTRYRFTNQRLFRGTDDSQAVGEAKHSSNARKRDAYTAERLSRCIQDQPHCLPSVRAVLSHRVVGGELHPEFFALRCYGKPR